MPPSPPSTPSDPTPSHTPHDVPVDTTVPVRPAHGAHRAQEETIGGRDLTSWRSRSGQALVRAVESAARRSRPAADWSLAHVAFVTFVAVAMVVIAGLTAAFHAVYEGVVDQNGVAGLDQPVLDLAVSWRSAEVDRAVTTFTDVGGPVGMPVLATLVAVALALTAGRWLPIVLALVAAAGSLVMTVVGKGFVGRARPPASLAVPPLESSPSFPSGHTLNATVLVTVLVYLVLIRTTALWQRVAAVALGVLFVLAMGLSRVFLGHHWLTDVIAGWTLGLAWAMAVIVGHRLLLTIRRHQPAGARSTRPADRATTAR